MDAVVLFHLTPNTNVKERATQRNAREREQERYNSNTVYSESSIQSYTHVTPLSKSAAYGARGSRRSVGCSLA